MYAIVEIAGQQFKVERGNKVYVHRLDANEGAKVEFDKVFLLDNGGKISVGNPTVDVDAADCGIHARAAHYCHHARNVVCGQARKLAVVDGHVGFSTG